MAKRKREEIKTKHALGNIGFKEAKKEIMEIEGPVIDDIDRKPISSKVRQLLLNLSKEALQEKTIDIDKILEKIKSNKDVRYLLKSGKITEDDILEILADSTKSLLV